MAEFTKSGRSSGGWARSAHRQLCCKTLRWWPALKRDSIGSARIDGGGDDGRRLGIAGTVFLMSKLRLQLAPDYSHMGRPSIDPELMIRMLLIGYCYGIRSERREEVDLNLAYRWFCRLNLEDRVPDHSTFSRIGTGAFARRTFCAVCLRRRCRHAWTRAWSDEKALPRTRASFAPMRTARTAFRAAMTMIGPAVQAIRPGFGINCSTAS